MKQPLFYSIGVACTLMWGCVGNEPEQPDDPVPFDGVVQEGDAVDALIGDDVNDFRVVSSDVMEAMPDVVSVADAVDAELLARDWVLDRTVRMSHRRPPRRSLIVGFPTRLLGEGAVFGSVITEISVPDDEFLGNFKLSQLPPTHVRPFLAPAEGGGYALALVGCSFDCSETSPKEELLSIPVLGVLPRKGRVFLDLSALGEGFRLGGLIDPTGRVLVEVDTRATLVDYASSTLVFDVRSELRPEEPAPDEEVESVFVTNRWYVALASRFEDSFVARSPTSAFGFFQTQRAAEPHITRFSTARYRDRPPIKYYIKNVPERYRVDFAAAFDAWNDVFREMLGYELLEYEFIDADDPRQHRLVTGDVRYNIVEWDVDNLASYGGLGPSAAHQFTGETFSGMVLIQGPTILELYQDWFNVLQEADELRQAGDAVAAERALVEGRRRLQARLPAAEPTGAEAQLGDLEFLVTAERPELRDPVMAGFDFDDTPPGVDFDTYMSGYMREIVSHEVGHNLGLTHNFKGSLSGDGDQVASHSVMEYVVRPERYKTRVSEYDRQAVGFGYTGVMAEEPLPFCADGGLPQPNAPTLSAECSANDAGPDPFAYLRDRRVKRALDLVIGRGLGGEVPVWTIDDVGNELFNGLLGVAFYATSAEATADTWVRFHAQPDRPSDPAAIRDYVIAELETVTCNSSIVDEISAKYALNPEAGIVARGNWLEVLGFVEFVGFYLDLPLGSCELVDELPF
ncbi:zinc-dependent metalloprotease [Haliangium sp.]|uniref:zinc-dependent metalloprotease n=1 Tax=Haliangium sp. TaxID=2663208 RepID=UPI003D0FCA46